MVFFVNNTNGNNYYLQGDEEMKIEDRKYDTFKEFFDATLPDGELGKHLHGYIFRGESSAKYELLPSALRPANKEKFYSITTIPINNQSEQECWQIGAEKTLLRKFYKIANNNGLKVPHIESIRTNYVDFFNTDDHFPSEVKKWISRDFEELTALAQHYGIPTRLLDWTFDLYVAMYFASISSIKKYDKITDKISFEEITSDNMVFWLLNAHSIQFLQKTGKRIPLNFVVPSYYNNANLNAQKGILSYWEIDDKGLYLTDEIDRTPLNKLIEKSCQHEENDKEVLLYKIEVPIHCCVEMYNYICKLGYSAARIFPGYGGVVRQLEEDKLSYHVGKIIETYK